MSHSNNVDMPDYIPLNDTSLPGLGNGQSLNGNGVRYGYAKEQSGAQAESTLNQNLQALIDSVSRKKEDVPSPISDEGCVRREPSPSPPPLTMHPHFILFGASENDLDNLIPRRSLQAMPERTLRKLATKGSIDGPSIFMKNYNQFDCMLRLKQFLDAQQYTPFKPRVFLEHTLPSGKTASWEGPTDGTEPLTAVNVTENTHALLVKEVDFYFFAIEISYPELRRRSVKNLIEGYPKSLKGIWMLIQRVYMQSDPEDNDLRDHICNLINTNRQELITLPSFEHYMRQFVTIEGKLGSILFSAYMKGAEELRRKVVELSGGKEPVRTKMSPPTPIRAEVKAELRDGPMNIGQITPRPTPSSKGSTPAPSMVDGASPFPANSLQPQHLDLLATSLNSQRILIAKKAGYGTLARAGQPRGERNRDFTFHAGELLLSNAFESAGSSHNLVVYNTRGERGDVLRDLVSIFPLDFGIHPRERGMIQHTL